MRKINPYPNHLTPEEIDEALETRRHTDTGLGGKAIGMYQAMAARNLHVQPMLALKEDIPGDTWDAARTRLPCPACDDWARTARCEVHYERGVESYAHTAAEPSMESVLIASINHANERRRRQLDEERRRMELGQRAEYISQILRERFTLSGPLADLEPISRYPDGQPILGAYLGRIDPS